MTDDRGLDTVIPRAELVDLLSAVGGPHAAVNWLCSMLGTDAPPPILDALANALADGRKVRVTLEIDPGPDGTPPAERVGITVT